MLPYKALWKVCLYWRSRNWQWGHYCNSYIPSYTSTPIGRDFSNYYRSPRAPTGPSSQEFRETPGSLTWPMDQLVFLETSIKWSIFLLLALACSNDVYDFIFCLAAPIKPFKCSCNFNIFHLGHIIPASPCPGSKINIIIQTMSLTLRLKILSQLISSSFPVRGSRTVPCKSLFQILYNTGYDL